MPTLLFAAPHAPYTHVEAILHHAHAYWVEHLAHEQGLTITTLSVFEGQKDLLLTGSAPQLLAYLRTLLQKGICGLALELDAHDDRRPFQALGPALTILMPTHEDRQV